MPHRIGVSGDDIKTGIRKKKEVLGYVYVYQIVNLGLIPINLTLFPPSNKKKKDLQVGQLIKKITYTSVSK